MPNILFLNATGSVARHAIDLFLKEIDAQLTLCARNARRLKKVDAARAHVVEGDVLDDATLEATARQDVAHAKLAGGLERMAKGVVGAMNETGLRRPVWISSMVS